jgi:hypothetical protein
MKGVAVMHGIAGILPGHRPSSAASRTITVAATILLGLVGLLASASNAFAVPAFALQTGQPCTACHIGGFGPQLTPFGRTFKLEGYTMRSGTDFVLPV